MYAFPLSYRCPIIPDVILIKVVVAQFHNTKNTNIFADKACMIQIPDEKSSFNDVYSVS